MTAKGLVPAPPNCEWRIEDAGPHGYDFRLSLHYSWNYSPLVSDLVPRERDLHRVSKRLVRKYQREQARKARVNRVLEDFNGKKAA